MSETADLNRYSPPKAELAEPASLTGAPEYAGRGMRLLAVFLDGIIGCLVIFPVFFIFGSASLFGTSDSDPSEAIAHMKRIYADMALGYLVWAVIQGWSLHAFGGTLGKKILGLRIVRTDGSRAGFVRLFFGRGAVAVVPACIPLLGGLYALVDSLTIFRESRQCLHDQIADTIVVTAASSTNASLEASRQR